MHAIALLQSGDDRGRSELLTMWEHWSTLQAPLERCTIAHFLADTESDDHAELEWDLCALEAATGSRESEDRQVVDPSLAGFLPSLHLNVGDAYRRLGNATRARRHLEIGLAHAHTLNDDGYGKTVLAGLNRLHDRLAEEGRRET